MKKLMMLMLGLAFLATTVTPTFAQDTTKKSKKKSKSKPKGETSKSGSKLL